MHMLELRPKKRLLKHIIMLEFQQVNVQSEKVVKMQSNDGLMR